ncbi:MAG: hypothetical protein M5U28_22770 [Sandaracinaceae bacterium]|nr:hypothetical protein [Sandaracinaceae bacterium]
MEDAGGVRLRERVDQRERHVERLVEREAPLHRDEPVDGPPGDRLGDHIRLAALGLRRVDHPDHAGVPDAVEARGLLEELLLRLRVAELLVREQPQPDGAIEVGVMGLEDDPRSERATSRLRR